MCLGGEAEKKTVRKKTLILVARPITSLVLRVSSFRRAKDEKIDSFFDSSSTSAVYRTISRMLVNSTGLNELSGSRQLDG